MVDPQEVVLDGQDEPAVPGGVPGRGRGAGARQREERAGGGARAGGLGAGLARLAQARRRRARAGAARGADAGRTGGVGPAAAAGTGPRTGTGDPEKSRGLLREGDPVSRFRFIDAEKAAFPIAVLCRALGVSRSGYYAWRGRAASA